MGMRKGRNRAVFLTFILSVVLVSAGLCGCGRTVSGDTAETELGEGQRKAEITVVSITGNEMTYTEAEEESEGATDKESEEVRDRGSEEATDKGSEEATGREPEEAAGQDRPGDGEMSEQGRPEDGEMPGQGRSEDGEMSEQGRPEDGEMSDQGRSENGEMPDMNRTEDDRMSGTDRHADGELPGMGQSVNTKTVYLPVGIVVHTDIGKQTTFSILEAGDRLEVLFETDEDGEEIITEIWMLGE